MPPRAPRRTAIPQQSEARGGDPHRCRSGGHPPARPHHLTTAVPGTLRPCTSSPLPTPLQPTTEAVCSTLHLRLYLPPLAALVL